jgi:hypothetical protein
MPALVPKSLTRNLESTTKPDPYPELVKTEPGIDNAVEELEGISQYVQSTGDVKMFDGGEDEISPGEALKEMWEEKMMRKGMTEDQPDTLCGSDDTFLSMLEAKQSGPAAGEVGNLEKETALEETEIRNPVEAMRDADASVKEVVREARHLHGIICLKVSYPRLKQTPIGGFTENQQSQLQKNRWCQLSKRLKILKNCLVTMEPRMLIKSPSAQPRPPENTSRLNRNPTRGQPNGCNAKFGAAHHGNSRTSWRRGTTISGAGGG